MTPLSRLLAPRSVAVVGGDAAARVVEQCRRFGFGGPIRPVSPTRADLGGIACVPSVLDLPEPPDAAFIGVNRHLTIDTMRQLREIGAGGAVCYGSGFAESGDDHLQRELIEAAGDMPFLGPNCYGYVNSFDRVALWPDMHGCEQHARGTAIVSQSGNVGLNLTFQQRGLRLGVMVSVGNQAVIGVEDVVDALLDDERITAIGMFLEAVRQPQRFASAAVRAAERGVPLVALQTGRSDAGAAIAASHTGSMAGRAAAYDAMFERYGVSTVSTPTELIETLKVLDDRGRLNGRRAVSLSCSGGEASLVADRAQGSRLRFDAFDDRQRARLASTLDELVSISNPLDYHTFHWGDRGAMADTFEAAMDGPQDVTMLLLDTPSGTDQDVSGWHTAVDALGDAADRTGGRAVVLATMPECLDADLRTHAVRRGLTPLLGLREGLAALDAAGPMPVAEVGPHAPAAWPRSATVFDEAAAKSLLRAAGLPVPDGEVAAPGEVVRAARRIGYPVTLKALGLQHKSELGAVHVGIPDEVHLAEVLERMPPSSGGYLVESTVGDVVAEMLVAVRRDPPVGWVVTIGYGGVTTEVWRDVVHLLAPVTTDMVHEAVRRLRCAPLLDGFRGRPRAAVGALVDLVEHLARWAVEQDVVEIELNPVLVGRHGAVAVDALLVVDDG